jgi:hypothetical protein
LGEYTVDSDLTSVWVHSDEECVARFGKRAFEVYGRSQPRVLAAFGNATTLQGWLDFSKVILDVHGIPIPPARTPIRFQSELGLEHGYDKDEPLFVIPLHRIAAFGNPFTDNIWDRGVVTFEKVKACIEQGHFESDFVPMGTRGRVDRDWDSRRIAYLVENQDDRPISIEILSLDGRFEIDDGWHRIAAAIYRGDLEIVAGLGGFIDGWEVAFPEGRSLAAETCPVFA